MGSWGTDLFESDTACDVRDTYQSERREGLNPAKAAKETRESLEDMFEDEEDGPIVKVALAATQIAYRELVPKVKAEALGVIESGEFEESRRENPDEADPQLLVLLQEFKDLLNNPTAPLSPALATWLEDAKTE